MTASPARLLAATVAATSVGLGLATGTGPLVGPVAAEFGVPRSAVAGMLAATLALTLGLGVVTGPWSQRHGPRPLVVLGAVAIPAGLLVLARTGSFPVAAAGFALGVGGGAGCLFVPLQTAVGAAFARHRAAALVVASAGAGLATVVAPPVTVALVGALGVRGTAVALAVIAAVVVGVCVPATPVGRGDATATTAGLRTALADPAFRRFVLGAVGVCAAMFVPFVHLASFATMRGAALATGAVLVAVAGTASLLARLAAVPAVARWGAWTVCRVGGAALVASVTGWLLADGSSVRLAAFAVVFGLGHGAFVGVSGAAVAELFGVAGFGLRLGTMHLAAGTGALLGPALAGVAADAAGSPSAGIAVAAALGVTGCAVFLSARSSERAGQREGLGQRG
ncbi:MFS transporter [Actinomycetospora flava]|uniref:MFS transporter n=1 Tax=Actinomycetospora flava TaxID=3129232 RepID=A0ABU8M7S8_9PSEU